MNQSKLPRGLPSAKLNCPPNSCMPNNVQMKTNTNNSSVMQTNELADLTTTAKITCIDFRARSNLATLSTRKVLKTRTVLNADKLPPPPEIAVINNSMIEMETTPPSSQFILSRRYFEMPTASNLEDISPMKIQVKISEADSVKFVVASSILYFSIPITIVLSSTANVIAESNILCLTIILSTTRAFFMKFYTPFGHTLTAFMRWTTQLDSSLFKPISKTSCPDHKGVLRLIAQSLLITY